jgi:hypothetical protein
MPRDTDTTFEAETRRADMALRSSQFARMASYVALGGRSAGQALALAESADAPAAVVKVLKAAVAGHATTSGGGEALADYQMLAQGFVAALASHGLYDGMLVDMMPAALHSQFGLLIAHSTAAVRTEGASAMAAKIDVQRGALAEREVTAIAALTKELFRHGRGLELLELSLRTAVAAGTDAVFATAVAAGATSATAVGMDARGIHEDLRHGLAALVTDAAARVHVGMSPALAKRLSAVSDANGQRAFPAMTLAGGALVGLPVHPTDACSADVLLLDAGGFIAGSDEVLVDSAEHASLKLEAPAPAMKSHDGASPPAPVEANTLNLWQTDSRAVRVRRRFGFEQVRSGAVVKLAGAAALWGLVGSPPA